ncbi:MAG: hypothetical protein RLY72_2171, partial [Planctomycetota bacterium]
MNDPFRQDHPKSAKPDSIAVRIAPVIAVVATAALLLALFITPHGGVETHAHMPDTWWIGVLPFVGLLAAIALFPLIPAIAHWWHSNLNRYVVSIAA